MLCHFAVVTTKSRPSCSSMRTLLELLAFAYLLRLCRSILPHNYLRSDMSPYRRNHKESCGAITCLYALKPPSHAYCRQRLYLLDIWKSAADLFQATPMSLPMILCTVPGLRRFLLFALAHSIRRTAAVTSISKTPDASCGELPTPHAIDKSWIMSPFRKLTNSKPLHYLTAQYEIYWR